MKKEGKAKTSAQFYKELGVKRLAARKEDIHTKKELNYLKKLLNKRQKILDLACGYGRLTIPLKKQGYNIEGVDISKNLLNAAKKSAKKEKLNIDFKLGDMRHSPYEKDRFDAIICLWSAFIELSKKNDQKMALKEMNRVLKSKGFAFLEMALPMNKVSEEVMKLSGIEKMKNHVSYGNIEGIERMPMYDQTKKSIFELMKVIKPSKYKASIDTFGGRKRFLVVFWKK